MRQLTAGKGDVTTTPETLGVVLITLAVADHRRSRGSSGRMLPHERLDVAVEVRVQDIWWPGVLEHRRQAGDDGWEGFVRWSTGPGENRIGWYAYQQLREV